MKKKAALLLCVFGVIIVSANIVLKINDNISVSIIGGADGPTSIFLAGKVGEDFTLLGIIVGLILIVSATILFVQRKR
ncbi:sodium ion-translocating decarboxylase subunit beta [Lachnoclostridium pacaense]|uniref:sodium ion-translocating decarboxylase subunit beta n=1 Tax=Enterocloster hominis (ex Hitch et al. 2024) TaxID=1917870 RepID=UPI001D11DD2C|nr:sodium ion-translocating decarboxylase subunit beta [Lachnoclostridium pacaense]MCC2817274.1 sodium ion-translocating decarboxylase subunit beta [Lachnoclostridium pacaense]